MPYLKVTCRGLNASKCAKIVEQLNSGVDALLNDTSSQLSRAAIQQKTTIHFVPDEVVDGFDLRTNKYSCKSDVVVEIYNWNINLKQQSKVSGQLRSMVANIFDIYEDNLDKINIRFPDNYVALNS